MHEFRWKLGHQVLALLYSFAIRDLLTLAPKGDYAKLDESLATYISAANALVPYTASIDASSYRDHLRPKMMMHHPSFSAHWWKEARQFRRLFSAQSTHLPNTRSALQTFWLLHTGVAEKMNVGPSLRQLFHETNEDLVQCDPYFDSFFLIARQDSAERELLTQLRRRLAMITMDLATNGIEHDPAFPNWTKEQPAEQIRQAILQAQSSAQVSTDVSMRFHHIACQVSDLDATMSWIAEVFGGRETWRMNGGYSQTTIERLPHIKTLVEVKTGDVLWHLFDVNADDATSPAMPSPPSQFQHVCVTIDDPAVFERLHDNWHASYPLFKSAYEKLAKPHIGVLCTDIINEPDGSREFYFTEPGGLEIEVRCERPAVKRTNQTHNDKTI